MEPKIGGFLLVSLIKCFFNVMDFFLKCQIQGLAAVAGQEFNELTVGFFVGELVLGTEMADGGGLLFPVLADAIEEAEGG